MNPLNLHIESLSPNEHKERDFYIQTLKDQEKYINLVSNPGQADHVILTDIYHPQDFAKIRDNPLAKKFPDKTLIVTESDQPIEVWPGLYTCGLNFKSNRNRIHGWYYPFFRVNFPNKEIQKIHQPEAREKKFLASFIGYPSHILRNKLSKTLKGNPEIYYSAEKDYHHFESCHQSSAQSRQQHYIDTLLSSRFSLCPRGRGPSTIRLFESMQLGIAPVIISDNWIPPTFIDWQNCSIIIKEKDDHKIYEILKSMENRSEELGKNARNVFESYLAPECLAKSMNQALNILLDSLDRNWNPSTYWYRKTLIKRNARFKIAYYKALFYGALNRIKM